MVVRLLIEFTGRTQVPTKVRVAYLVCIVATQRV